MRTAFIEALLQAAERDERVWLLCGDLGYSVLEPFAERFPERYFNAGVSEQNMTGVAAGLALSGNIVFTYSIANFPTLRPLEQIRNDICYHGANVKIVSVGGGLSYGGQGYTHHGVEDLGIMRLLPDMVVIAPGDPHETRAAVDALIAHDGPGYLRLGKAGEPIVHEGPIDFKIGRALTVRAGNDVTLLAIGGVLSMAMEAAAQAASIGIEARVLSVHTLSPLDDGAILRAARETAGLVVIEEHGPGALATAVAELLVATGTAVPMRRVGLAHTPLREAGSQSYLRERGGLSLATIADAVRSLAAAPSGMR